MLLASSTGIFLKAGTGRKIKTPIPLNRKCAIAILTASGLVFREAAIKAVTVVPMLAPMMKGTACLRLVIFFATIGTTTDVVMVLERIAAEVRRTQRKDFILFMKTNRLKANGDLANSKSEMSFRKIRIEDTIL